MLQALALGDTLRDHTKRAPALGDGHTHETAVGEFQACAAAASVAVGFPRLRFTIPFAVLALQCRSGFRFTIFDERTRGDNSKPPLERVVAGEDGEEPGARRE
jgi:hypothetical protein